MLMIKFIIFWSKGDRYPSVMNTLLALEIPELPPTVNSMYRNSNSRRYKRPEVTGWQEEIAVLMSEQWGAGRPPYTGRVSVCVSFIDGCYRAWDIDNRLKSLLDCLEIAGILKNDNQIDSLQVTRCKGKEDSTRIILMEYKERGEQCVK